MENNAVPAAVSPETPAAWSQSASHSEQKREVPNNAFQFNSPLQFEAPAEKLQGELPIELLLRSPQPITHWYWGRIAHDMTGLQLRKETCPLDWCHDADTIVGYLDQFSADATQGLRAKGKLVSFTADDKAAEIMHKGQHKVPYESSMDWSGPAVIEEIGEGITIQVNGYAFTGPGYVVRKWQLRSAAVCPYGADPNTRSKFSAGESPKQEVSVFTFSEVTMSQAPSTPATPPAPAVPAAATQQTVDPRVTARAELTKFVSRFGAENGSKWFAEGVSYEAACDKHIDAQNQQLTAKDTQIGELQQKLSAVPKQGEKPLSGGDAEKKHTSVTEVIRIK